MKYLSKAFYILAMYSMGMGFKSLLFIFPIFIILGGVFDMLADRSKKSSFTNSKGKRRSHKTKTETFDNY